MHAGDAVAGQVIGGDDDHGRLLWLGTGPVLPDAVGWVNRRLRGCCLAGACLSDPAKPTFLGVGDVYNFAGEGTQGGFARLNVATGLAPAKAAREAEADLVVLQTDWENDRALIESRAQTGPAAPMMPAPNWRGPISRQCCRSAI